MYGYSLVTVSKYDEKNHTSVNTIKSRVLYVLSQTCTKCVLCITILNIIGQQPLVVVIGGGINTGIKDRVSVILSGKEISL